MLRGPKNNEERRFTFEHLSFVHTPLQRSCVADIDYFLLQLNATHYTSNSLLLGVLQCSSRCRDGNTIASSHRNAYAVKYERRFSIFSSKQRFYIMTLDGTRLLLNALGNVLDIKFLSSLQKTV